MVYLVLDHVKHVKAVKSILEKEQLFEKSKGIVKCDHQILIGVKTQLPDALLENIACARFVDLDEPREPSFLQKVLAALPSVQLHPHLTVPRRFSVYPPLLLFSASTFDSPDWQALLSSLSSPEDKHAFFRLLIAHLGLNGAGITHIAVCQPIHKNDPVRRPTIRELYGDFGSYHGQSFCQAFWCSTVQNGIHQVWAPRHTMFSRGNIKEKARLMTLSYPPIRNHTVVDLFGGIGYFAFSYASCGARQVHCWELNPWSVEGLRRGSVLNGWSCHVVDSSSPGPVDHQSLITCYCEDNKKAPSRLARLVSSPRDVTHINLGLLPHSKAAYSVAVEIAQAHGSTNGVMLHVHENVAGTAISEWARTTSATLSSLSPTTHVTISHIERIKTFAPGVWHVCGDFLLEFPSAVKRLST